MYFPGSDSLQSVTRICDLVSDELRLPLESSEPVNSGKELRIRLYESPAYALEVYGASICAEGCKESGDTSLVFNDGTGVSYVILSDGMGSGKKAAFEPTMVVRMFRKLISVSRIGPKVALAVLSVLTPSDVALAVLTDNTAAFDGVAGMGKNTAARVILELEEKVDAAETAAASAGGAANTAQDNGMRAEAVAALVALGYDGASAGRAVASVPDCDRVEDMIMQALRATTK